MRETSDDYPYIVTMLNDNARVIECSGDMQWIVQLRPPSGEWRGRSYYRRSQYLNRDYGPNAVLAALPPMYIEGRRKNPT